MGLTVTFNSTPGHHDDDVFHFMFHLQGERNLSFDMDEDYGNTIFLINCNRNMEDYIIDQLELCYEEGTYSFERI